MLTQDRTRAIGQERSLPRLDGLQTRGVGRFMRGSLWGRYSGSSGTSSAAPNAALRPAVSAYPRPCPFPTHPRSRWSRRDSGRGLDRLSLDRQHLQALTLITEC